MLRTILQPRDQVVTICFTGQPSVPYKTLPGETVRFVSRPLPPEDRRPNWAIPGICGAVETIRILKGYSGATSQHFCDLLFLHPYWYAVFVAAARVAIRTGHAPRDWQNAVVNVAYERTRMKLSEIDWRAKLDASWEHIGATVRRFALNRCREALRGLRKAEGYESRSRHYKRREFSEAEICRVPNPAQRIERTELLGAVQEAIASLNAAERYVFQHRTVDNETLSTVAAAIGLSVGQTRCLEGRAIRGIRKKLALNGWSVPRPRD